MKNRSSQALPIEDRVDIEAIVIDEAGLPAAPEHNKRDGANSYWDPTPGRGGELGESKSCL